MRLHVQLFEDARGARSVGVGFSLHGPIDWPSDPIASWSKVPSSKAVDVETRPLGLQGRSLAELDVLARDETDEALVGSLIQALQAQMISAAPGAWVESGGVAARLLITSRAQPEKASILAHLSEAAQARLRRRNLRTSLRVLRLELEDFRIVDKLTLVFPSLASAVLVGANGSGKTTILDAVGILLGHLEAGIRGASKRPRELSDNDITHGSTSTTIKITAEVGGNPVTWSLSRTRGGEPTPAEERSGLFKLDEEVAHIRAELARGDVCLPIAVHYPVNRAVLDIPLRIRTPHSFEPLEAYDGALARGRSNFRLFFEWFRDREDLENEVRLTAPEHRDHQLEAVRRAILSLLPEVSSLRVQRSPLGMVATKGEWTLYVDQLSDGEKCLLAMTGDLARRLAMANPLADEPLHGGGVVIIDEIELHLHPGWQRRVLPALERTFPNCQFIVSTHSPAVLGHVDHESVLILKPEATGVRVARPDTSRGMDVNRILEDILDVPARPVEFEQKLSDMHRLLDAGDTSGARAVHEELSGILGADDPALVKADVLLRRREARR